MALQPWRTGTIIRIVDETPNTKRYWFQLSELEVFDFFGVKFNNHPGLRRLFMPKEWVGFPLRKDYVDEVNMVIK